MHIGMRFTSLVLVTFNLPFFRTETRPKMVTLQSTPQKNQNQTSVRTSVYFTLVMNTYRTVAAPPQTRRIFIGGWSESPLITSGEQLQ